jgi:hypothetical protein
VPGARIDCSAISSKTAISSTQSAFHRPVLPCGNPPPFSRLCRREPASGARALLALPKVSLWGRGARPDAFPRGPSAARRLLQPKQSASTCCRSSDPWPRPEVALSDGSRWAAPLSPRIQRSVTKKRSPSRGFTGQGPGWLSPFRHLSSRLLVTRALPQPDPLGHLLSWTGGVTGWIVRERQARALGVSLLRVHPSSSLARSPPRPWSAHLREGRG